MIEPTKIYNDPYKHRISILEYGLHKRQVKCDGSYCETEDNETAYHYDKFGRYTIDQNEKIYERATCASSYKLDENKLFQKVTVDCGHSEAPNKECEIEFKDPTDEPIFPIPPHCSGQMDQNAMTYIFEHFGAILPTALADVEKLRPRNPIHYLGHRLLRLKYTKTAKEWKMGQDEFSKYFGDITKEKEQKAATDHASRKRQQIKRRKPEESDDALEWQLFHRQMALEHFVNYVHSDL